MKVKKFFTDWMGNERKLTTGFVVISTIVLVLSITKALKFMPFDIAWVAIVLCGVPILFGAIRGLIIDHDIKADVLVAMALVASVATKQYFAAGEVALIMQIGSLLEDYTSGKAQESIEKLVNLTPQKARVLRDGAELLVPVEEVRVGDTVQIRAGETIPVDGTILTGETSIDQSVMTGESIPVDKAAGDKVSSGTINQYGVFTMKADKVSEDSSLQRMVRLAKEAEQNQAPVVSLADKWATWLVVVALLCAIITWIVTKEFMRAVTVLVVFCPCAFILATPTAVLAGIGNAAKYGIIIRSGNALEKLAKIKRVAFDKTGTLTYGKPQVSNVYCADSRYTKEDLLRFTAAAEQQSEHPLGKAIVKSCEGMDIPEAANVKIIPGQGVQATVNRRDVLVGKSSMMEKRGIDLSALKAKAGEFLQGGATVIYVAIDGKAAGIISLADKIREDTAATISKLKAAGVTPMILTGDNSASAAAIAREAGIEDVRADLLPEEKMSMIKEYTTSDEPICMTGDGVNDALALTTANAGIAMGGIGSDIAIESADAVLVSDDIKRIPYLFRLTQKVMSKIRINLIIAMIINITAVVLSALGILTPVTGALWHNAGSVFVVVNAALLLRFKDKEADPGKPVRKDEEKWTEDNRKPGKLFSEPLKN